MSIVQNDSNVHQVWRLIIKGTNNKTQILMVVMYVLTISILLNTTLKTRKKENGFLQFYNGKFSSFTIWTFINFHNFTCYRELNHTFVKKNSRNSLKVTLGFEVFFQKLYLSFLKYLFFVICSEILHSFNR